jgi:hypothetical protein
MQVTRYFHLRPFGHMSGGACVQVTANTEHVGQVDVQVAKCSKKDSYVKKIGRTEASIAPIKVVPLRYLPQELGRIWESNARLFKGEPPTDFTFSLKYFLPKE